MSTTCPITGRPCDTSGRCSQPAGCVRKAPETLLTRYGQPLSATHHCRESCQLSSLPGKVHPHCEDRKDCHLWPDTDLDKAAVQSLADHLLQRTPEQERRQRAWMFGDWTLELSDTEPEGVVTRPAVHKALNNIDFVPEVRSSVYGKPNVRRCTLGVGCEEVGQCYASAHGEPDRCGAPASLPARCPWDQWKAARDL